MSNIEERHVYTKAKYNELRKFFKENWKPLWEMEETEKWTKWMEIYIQGVESYVPRMGMGVQKRN